jgi:DNA repair exonuclease SbcCD ATPase subunit
MGRIADKLDVAGQGMPAARKRQLEAELQKLQDSLDEPNRRFVAYQNALEGWTQKRALIVGSVSTPQSIMGLEHRLGELAGIPAKLQELRVQRSGVAREIYRETKTLAEAYRRLYRPVEQFVAQQEIASEAIPLSFQVAIVEEGFASGFLEKINRQVRGTFSGIEESHSLVRRRLQAVDFDNEDSVLAFIDDIETSLHSDKRPGALPGSSVQAAEQLRKGETPGSVYDYLYSLSFLTPRYTLRYRGHEIHQLSPGERGLLLLVFYLLIDNNDMPLVIDQPEENLDNQTIYEVLVRCLSSAKLRRQVIVVTHNPNLGVVCDAEQVVYARRDTAPNAIKYESGAIENPVMNKHIIDVLEGTRPAFENRDSKYFA